MVSIEVVSDWVQTSGMGIATSTQKVSNGDTVVFNGIKYTIDLKAAKEKEL